MTEVQFTVKVADITTQKVDAIVNAANPSLLGGGGVDGAIHRAAGPELRAYCESLGGCEPGDAKVTPGFGLAAPWIIHTVGPVWRGGTHNEAELLASCYRRCLELGRAVQARSIAFPAISTGVYGYPRGAAAEIATRTVTDGLLSDPSELREVVFVCFDRDTARIYSDLVNSQDPVVFDD